MKQLFQAKSGARTAIGAAAALAVGVIAIVAAAQVQIQVMGAPNAQTPSAPSTQNGAPPGPLPSFEVASIKKHADTGGPSFIALSCGRDPGRCTPTNVTTKMLIVLAYNVKDFQVLGGPSWINAQRFDIQGKVDDATAEQLQQLPPAQRQEQLRLMMQSLLADRFKLSVTHGNKDVPAFALVPSKGGTKVTAVPPPPAPAQNAPQGAGAAPMGMGRGGGPPTVPVGGFVMSMGAGGKAIITGKAVEISVLTNMLSQQLGKPVLNQTGLLGTYDITLQYTSDTGLGGAPLPPSNSDATADAGGDSIFTALQDQLGLRLQETKTPVDTLTIEHIEQPSEN
jgi:uncharacterized protein (TIGR03435 family)